MLLGLWEGLFIRKCYELKCIDDELNCIPQNSYDEELIPRTSEWNCIWRWAFYRGDEFKMRMLGRALIQSNQCPNKKRKPGHTKKTPGMYALRGHSMVCKPKRNDSFRRNETNTLISGFQLPKQ